MSTQRSKIWITKVALVAVLAFLTGCITAPAPTDIQDQITVAQITGGLGSAHDLRGDYRMALCSQLLADRACNDVLLTLPNEPAARVHPANPAAPAARYRIAFVSGLFADCAEKWVRPFSDAIEELQVAGFDTAVLRVAGRAGTEQNAAQLAQEIAALPQDGKRLIVFAYSKGLPDVLDLILRHPGARSRIAAVVSYAGAFNGSPLTDDMRGIYDQFVSKLPLDGCAVGTGAELEALRPSVRKSWWQAHSTALRATRIPFFSLVGAPLPERVSPALRLNHTSLAKRDPNNDSQLLAVDAVVPGGALLGFVNADHWAMAIPLSKEFPALAALFRDDLPRGALVRAAITVVDENLYTTRNLSVKQ